MTQFVQVQMATNAELKKNSDHHGQVINDIRGQLTHITQALSNLTTKEVGKLPAQPCPNPSRQVLATEGSSSTSTGHEQVQSVTTLRDRKSTRLNSSHSGESRMPSSA